MLLICNLIAWNKIDLSDMDRLHHMLYLLIRFPLFEVQSNMKFKIKLTLSWNWKPSFLFIYLSQTHSNLANVLFVDKTNYIAKLFTSWMFVCSQSFTISDLNCCEDDVWNPNSLLIKKSYNPNGAPVTTVNTGTFVERHTERQTAKITRKCLWE